MRLIFRSFAKLQSMVCFTTFKTFLMDKKAAAKILADQTVDINLLHLKVCQKTIKAVPKISIGELSPPYIYKGLLGGVCLKCTKHVVLNVRLKSWPGSSRLLKDILWNIPEENISLDVF